ncbi:MAG TPA: hypothetical protein VMT34_13610, partial [Aggregatilineales bacterium]|nr:hypothetical protein [Aggregatilineales bacterium]
MKRVQHLNQLTLLTLVSFAIVAMSLTYWSAFAAPWMLARPDNPRRVEAEQAIHRGAIVDRNGNPLAYNVDVRPLPSGWLLQKRVYPYPEAAHVVGYYSLTYGVGGTEDAFDRILRGDDLRDESAAFRDSLLHRAEVGSDVRLTIDLNLQKTIASALGNRRGAALVLDVPSGAVLAMVSQPTFDANQLDDNYKT